MPIEDVSARIGIDSRTMLVNSHRNVTFYESDKHRGREKYDIPAIAQEDIITNSGYVAKKGGTGTAATKGDVTTKDAFCVASTPNDYPIAKVDTKMASKNKHRGK